MCRLCRHLHCQRERRAWKVWGQAQAMARLYSSTVWTSTLIPALAPVPSTLTITTAPHHSHRLSLPSHPLLYQPLIYLRHLVLLPMWSVAQYVNHLGARPRPPGRSVTLPKSDVRTFPEHKCFYTPSCSALHMLVYNASTSATSEYPTYN